MLLHKTRSAQSENKELSQFHTTDLDSTTQEIIGTESTSGSPSSSYPRDKSALERYPILYALLPLALAMYVFDVFVIIPICQVLGKDAFVNLSPFKSYELETAMAMIFYSENAKRKPLLSSSSLAGVVFGVIHCLAWHFTFPSHIEKIIWRASSLCVVSTCALTFISVFIYYPFNGLMARMYDPIRLFGNTIVFVLVFLIPVIYPLARVTLLILAVSSLRSLPPSAFDTVRWIELIPHI